MDNAINITRADLKSPPRGGRRPLVPGRLDLLPQAAFVAQVVGRRLPHLSRDAFRGSADPAQLGELATPVVVRADARGDEVEAFIEMDGGALALVDAGHHHVRVEVAALTPEAARAAARLLRQALASEPQAPERISLAFWMRGEFGGEVRHRQIDAPAFQEIRGNYAAPVHAALERLMRLRAPESGRLILWRGEPGTGKSHALRALAREWASWCSAHFIMDPEELLGRGGPYLLDLLAATDDDDAADEKWRLWILEDAGELIASDARATAGQALSRLLNVADGLLGQGTRTLILITTNEPLKRLHPATLRPGRCLADIEFCALAPGEANAWLAARGQDRRVHGPTTLAELFGSESEAPTAETPVRHGFGFARALDAPRTS